MIWWKKRKKIVLSVVLVLTVSLLAGCMAPLGSPMKMEAADRLVLRLVTDLPEDSQGFHQLEQFQRVLAEQSQQTMTVKLYAKDEWGQKGSFLEYLHLETLEMAAVCTADLTAVVPAYEIYDLPYLFDTAQDVASYTTGPKGTEALNLLTPAGYHGVGFVGNGYLYFLQNRASVSDGLNHWSGLTMAVANRPLYHQALQAVGIKGVAAHGTNTLNEARCVDSAEVKRLIGLNLVNEGTYLNDPQMFYQLQMVVCNQKWWDKLTPEQQQLINDSYQKALQDALNIEQNSGLATTFAQGGVTLDPVDPALRMSLKHATEGVSNAYLRASTNVLARQWQPVVTEGAAEMNHPVTTQNVAGKKK